MTLPFDEERGIIAQDRDFLNKGAWPYSKAETKYPLLLNYHPLTIYRYQISKQADAVLALMLFQDTFDNATIEKVSPIMTRLRLMILPCPIQRFRLFIAVWVR